MDLWMSGITCQKLVKIYKQRSIMKRPELVNEVSRFVSYGSFPPLQLFSLLLHQCLRLPLRVRCFYEPYNTEFIGNTFFLVKQYSFAFVPNLLHLLFTSFYTLDTHHWTAIFLFYSYIKPIFNFRVYAGR